MDEHPAAFEATSTTAPENSATAAVHKMTTDVMKAAQEMLNPACDAPAVPAAPPSSNTTMMKQMLRELMHDMETAGGDGDDGDAEAPNEVASSPVDSKWMASVFDV
jgi:hypothetical protein